eukprot:scaffold78790_cov29-Tisochrysis_lutea.AAC.1
MQEQHDGPVVRSLTGVWKRNTLHSALRSPAHTASIEPHAVDRPLVSGHQVDFRCSEPVQQQPALRCVLPANLAGEREIERLA